MGALTVVGLTLALSLFVLRSAEGRRTCGERKIAATALIAHAYTARDGAWPWHGALFHKYGPGFAKYTCGVTILTEQIVLTAAHCTYESWERLPPGRIFIKVGFTNLDLPEYHVRQFNVDRIIRHEEYDKDTFENDIALLMLYNEITYNSYIQPVCLWQNNTELSKIISKTGYVIGWGLNEEYTMSKKLSETTMPIVSSTECRKRNNWHYYKFYFESKTFCAGHLNDTYVSHGDSGGGLYMRMGSNWVLRGLVSNAKSNSSTLKIQADSYTIFTDVAYYLGWIKTKVLDIPYLAVDTELITETEFEGDANLLGLGNCGKYTQPAGTQEDGIVLVKKYPWEVDIKIYNTIDQTYRRWCIGFLIHPNFVMSTAGSFKPHQDGDEFFAWINDFNGIDDSYSMIRISDTFIHPDYSSVRRANNIAIVKLNRSAIVNPICLPLSEPLELSDASPLYTVGVHLHDRTRYFQNVTQLVDLEICHKQLTEKGVRIQLTTVHVCSILDGDFSDWMYYLVSRPWQRVKKEPQYFLAAYSPFAIWSSTLPTVFTNVTYYSKWIRETIEQN